MLDRKLARDLRLWIGQILAIAAVAACGIMSFITMQSNYDTMLTTQTSYYDRYRFADVFASMTRAPRGIVPRIAQLPGVVEVQTRVVRDVLADIPGQQDVGTLRLISIPDGSEPRLNKIFVRYGRLPQVNASNEIVISQAFADANHLQPGSTISALLNRRYQTFRIVGVGLSPEYVYEMRGGADIWPDSRHFGIAWINDSALAAAFDMTDGFNDISLHVAPGSDRAQLIERLDRILAPYGSLGAYDRAEQLSDRFVSNELRQLRAQAIAIPLIFLGVASFLINTALSRLVATQREQIAVLKAFGYSNVAIATHFLKAANVVIAIGAVTGIAGGWWLGYQLAIMYTRFFRFPAANYHLDPSLAIVAVLISLAAAALGAISSVYAVVKLPPAEAMRPVSPVLYRPTLLERIGITLFSPSVRIVIRSIARKPVASLLTMLAIAFSVAILVVGRSTIDSVQWMMRIQFQLASRETATIAFVRSLGSRASYELRTLPGVLQTQPYRTIFVRISNGNRSRRLALLGLPREPRLHGIIDRNGSESTPPVHGLLLTKALADILAIRPGERVTIAFLEGDRRVIQMPVQQVSDELVGLNAYADLAEAHRVLRESGTISGAWVTIDPLKKSQFDAALKRMPAVAGVSYRQAALDEFNRSFAESIGISATFILGFAFVIACGVVYNAGRVALSERARELSTLRILGYDFQSTAFMLVGEQILLAIAGIPVGFLIGYLLDLSLQPLYELEYYRVPIVTSNATYVLSAAFTLGAASISAALIALQLRRLDLVAALKAGE